MNTHSSLQITESLFNNKFLFEGSVLIYQAKLSMFTFFNNSFFTTVERLIGSTLFTLAAMKKLLSFCLIAGIGLALSAWGPLGHHVIGEIAEHHLTPEAKAAVKDLLGHETLADVSSWADDIRKDNPTTGPLHFMNLPLGLTYAQFEQKIKNMREGNVYVGILGAENTLKNTAASQWQRMEALKYLVHFVGDAHQPMHVSRAEDRGGNNIRLMFENDYTSLHAIWDTNLLEKDGMNYKKLAGQYDHATDLQISKWQSDPVITWIWESYQISSVLYAETDTLKGGNLPKNYYETHIPVVRLRIEKAGIRLAGVLNEIFKAGGAK
jgi:hypothetical protein